jgi:coenzyme F420-reducing hydrogenase delta subunit
MTTSERGVFSCGEVMTGPGSAIQAVSTGHDAAKSIDYFLRTGDILKLPQKRVEIIGSLPRRVASKAKKTERREVELMDAAERATNFTPIEPGFTEPEALAESRRCLACAKGAVLQSPEVCAGCLTCARICPYGVATVNRTASMPSQECLTCGLCAAECPAAGIALARFATNRMADTLRTILGKTDPARIARPFVVSYCCLNETTSRQYLKEQSEAEIELTGILRVMVPCVGRLGQLDLVTPFELGADRVVVISCSEGQCSNVGAEELLQRRVDHVRKFLDEIRIGGANLQLHATRGSAETSWPEIWKAAKSSDDTEAAV